MSLNVTFIFLNNKMKMFLFLFLCFGLCATNVRTDDNSTAETYPILSDGSIITINLKVDNASVIGKSFVSMYKIEPNSNCQINITSIPSDVHFVVLQVHSYLQNMTLSHDNSAFLNNSVNGTNMGLLKLTRINAHHMNFYLSSSNSTTNTSIMIVVQPYASNSPIPGGCNLEFPVEISPFLKTTFNKEITEVDFAPASPPETMLKRFWITSISTCDLKPSPVMHSMYRLYLPERDFTEETYFTTLRSMITIDDVKHNGKFVYEKVEGLPMRRLFASYPGTGSIFVVIAETSSGISVYVPSFTYGCDISDGDNNNSCQVLTTVFSKIFCASIFFIGLLVCLTGHFFFKLEMFLLGFWPASLMSYIMLNDISHVPDALAISMVIGFALGIIVVTFWCCCCGYPFLSIILATLAFGYIIASVIFYPLVDAVDVLVNDINYWSMFFGIIIFFVLSMLCLSEKANIIACSVFGSYALIVAIDYYVGSNLRYIIINTIRRGVVNRFNTATLDPPFQYKDILLCVAWTVLIAVGTKVQLILLKGKPPFPAPYNIRNRPTITKNFRILIRQPSESSPLLRSF